MVDHTTTPTSGNLPLIAILRGIQTSEVVDVAEVLCAAGVETIEIPLNSPNALDSIDVLVNGFGDRAVCGAGTVLTANQVKDVVACGAKLIVSPNTNPDVIQAALKNDLHCLPGVATVTEAFTAIDCGARNLKLFPAGDLGAGYLKSIAAVLPADVRVVAVGNIAEPELKPFYDAGARGFGIGSALYTPGIGLEQLKDRAEKFVDAVKSLR